MTKTQRLYARNAKALARMAAKAAETGRPVNGYFSDELTRGAATYHAMATAPTHIAESMIRAGYARAMARLAELREAEAINARLGRV